MKPDQKLQTCRTTIRMLVTIIFAASTSIAVDTIPAGSTAILSAADHERIYQTSIDDFTRRSKTAEEEIAALEETRSKPKDEFETTEQYNAQQTEIRDKIERTRQELNAAQAKREKDKPLPTHMIITFTYVIMGAYDADATTISEFFSLYSAESKGSVFRIIDPYIFGDAVVESTGIFGHSYYRAVSVSGKFAAIHCLPSTAKKIRDASNHHRLLAKVLIPDSTTTCARERVYLNTIRPDDFEPGSERLNATLKMFSKNNTGEAQIIEITAKGDGTIFELFDGDTSLWKTEGR